jgi:MFS family permease
MTQRTTRASLQSWWVLALLGSLYIFSFVDRGALAMLVRPLSRDLALSDVRIGLLFGTAFAIFYGVLGLPIARLADRKNRRVLIASGVILWSLSTIATGFANSFALLVVLRIGLGIGEAALTPSAYSLISDLFSERQRALAASIYSAVGMGGASISPIFIALLLRGMGNTPPSGLLQGFHPWQVIFLAIGIPSLLLGFVYLLTTREPERVSEQGSAPNLAEVIEYLRQNARLYGGLFAGGGTIQAIAYGFVAWGPELLRRKFGLPIESAGLLLGAVALPTGVLGTLAVPFVVRLLERNGRRDAIVLTSLGGLVVGAISVVIALLQSSVGLYIAFSAVGLLCLVSATNNILISLQFLAPDRMRATLVALYLMCITLFGLGIGPAFVGYVSTLVHSHADGLPIGLGVLTVLVFAVSTVLLSYCRGSFLKTLSRPGTAPAR